jgi:hypothetical protein
MGGRVEHLPLDAQTLMNEPENELLFSVASQRDY